MINQPLNNRGDESAHKALIKRILQEIQEAEITVLFMEKKNTMQDDSIKQFMVNSPRVKYVVYRPWISRGISFFQRIGQKYEIPLIWRLHPGVKGFMSYFKNADVVLCAPGGMCMGGFQRWGHVFNLQCAKYYNKPLAYYGRSFGPFPTKTSANRRFKDMSIEMLNYISYLSIRDRKTEQIADELGINKYVSTIDSAFLETPKEKIPQEFQKVLRGNSYFVFVPNLLIWHPAYKGVLSKKQIIEFYNAILDILFDKYPRHKAVMLPQTFDCDTDDGNDINLFMEIKRFRNDSRLIVIDDTYSSDVQQAIIAEADLMVGARYHSVVFAINNNTPLIALSYEHKIAGLLENLGKTDCMVNIQKGLESFDGRKIVLNDFKQKLLMAHNDVEAMNKAHCIAAKGFDTFKTYIYNNSAK